MIPVRIGDINYGNHLGNDAVLSIIHEARMQWLASWGATELSAAGNSLIMGDVMIAYRGEGYYGDILSVELFVVEVTDRSFDLLYRISVERGETESDIAHAKTGMITFNYKTRKIEAMGEALKKRLQAMEK